MSPIKKAAEMTERELARYIDQSVLKPEFTVDEIKKWAQEGIGHYLHQSCQFAYRRPHGRGNEYRAVCRVRLPLWSGHH